MKGVSRFIGMNNLTALAVSLLALPLTAQATIINIDATNYGYVFPTDPAPLIGQTVSPFAASGVLNQLTLGPGTYSIQNAAGMAGATPSFTGWRFNNGGSSWVWNFVIVDDLTKKVVYYGERGGARFTQADIAADPLVKAFSDTFSLGSSTTLDFMIRDYYLPDNAGGVSLSVTTVPEPETYAMMLAGLGMMGFMVRRRKQR